MLATKQEQTKTKPELDLKPCHRRGWDMYVEVTDDNLEEIAKWTHGWVHHILGQPEHVVFKSKVSGLTTMVWPGSILIKSREDGLFRQVSRDFFEKKYKVPVLRDESSRHAVVTMENPWYDPEDTREYPDRIPAEGPTVEIDKGMQVIIAALWSLGYETMFCCENNNGQAYISFRHLDDAERVLILLLELLHTVPWKPDSETPRISIEAASHGRGVIRFAAPLLSHVQARLDEVAQQRARIPGRPLYFKEI